jgi:hypothetical protein
MAAELFEFKKGYWYPHMKPRDVAIWERFIDAKPVEYEKCQYDVGVGDVPEFIQNASSVEGQRMGELYKLKIDVLGYLGDTIDLIEVKPSAGASTIGQVLGYVTLYNRDYKPTKKIQPVILTDELRPNMEFLCKENGVTLYVV